MRKLILSCMVLAVLSCKNDHKNEKISQELRQEYKTLGSIEKLSDNLDVIIDVNSPLEVISEGYDWSEGPLWLEKEQMLLWSDVPQNTVYSWKEGESAKVYLKPSGDTGEGPTKSREPGANGLHLDPQGRLVLCQHGDRRISYMDAPLNEPRSKFVTLADNFMGKRFSSPNDAAFDSMGNLFFTDPPYGLTGIDESPDKELSFNGVYKLDPEGRVSLMDSTMTKPNGIAFNADFSKCYVSSSDPDKAIIMVHELNNDQTLVNGRVFFDATSMVKDKPGLPDGLKVNKAGIVFATGPGGVLILSPEGEHLGTINTGQATANCTFNSDESVLFITADSYILKVKLK